MAQLVKSLPAVGETQVRSLGCEDPLEKEMATHSSTLAWKIPGRGVAKSRAQPTDFTFTSRHMCVHIHTHRQTDGDKNEDKIPFLN